MRAVIVSDLQAHNWENCGTWNEEGRNLRLLDVVNELERIRKFCIRNSVTWLWVLGDVFQARGKLDVSVLNSMYSILSSFRESGIRILLLVGNHDRTSIGGETSLEIFREFCVVVSEPARYKCGDVPVVAIPFMPEPEDTKQAMKDLRAKEAGALLMHTGVMGTKLRSGIPWKEGIDLTDIPIEPYTFIGHFHNFKKLRSRVWFVGSLLQVDWGDEGTQKYFAMYGPEFGVKFFKTKGPEFKTVDLTQPWAASDVSGNFIRYTSEHPVPVRDVGKIKNKMLQAGARYVEYVQGGKFVVLEDTITMAEQSMSAYLAEYVDYAVSPLRRERLISLGESVLQKASERFDR